MVALGGWFPNGGCGRLTVVIINRLGYCFMTVKGLSTDDHMRTRIKKSQGSCAAPGKPHKI